MHMSTHAMIKNGWIQKICVGGATGLGRKNRPRILNYMVEQGMSELVDRNGVWWIKPCPAGSGAAPDAPAIDGGVPAGLVALSAAAQQPSSMPQQQQQQQQQQPVATEKAFTTSARDSLS